MKSGGESTHWKPCKSSESHTMEPQDQASVHTNLPKAGLCYHKGFWSVFYLKGESLCRRELDIDI